MRSMLAIAVTAATGLAQVFIPAPSQPQLSELNSRLNYPLMRASSRMQLVVAPSEIGSAGASLFGKLSLRFDGPTLGAQGGTIASVEVRMAPAAVEPAASTGVFAANMRGAPTRVFLATNWSFPADTSPNPEEFGGTGGALAFPFQTPYVYLGGPLVIEVLASGNSNAGSGVANCMLDAEVEPLGGAQSGTTLPNGSGCDGAALALAGQIAPGGPIALSAQGLGSSLPAVGVLGTSRTAWGSIPLPLDLGFLGATGCALRNDWLLDRGGTTSPAGTIDPYTSAFTWPIPPDTAFNGVALQFQIVAAKLGANPANLVTTNNVEARLGSWRAPTRAYMAHFHHQDLNASIAAFSSPVVPAMRLE